MGLWKPTKGLMNLLLTIIMPGLLTRPLLYSTNDPKPLNYKNTDK